MSESTTPAQCRDDDWNLARDCGLMAAAPGTNAWDAALGRLARAIEARVRGDGEDLQQIYDVFGIGAQARTQSVLLANIRNTKHFADCLDAVEREFFMVPGEPSDEPEDEGFEPSDECLLNRWGSTIEQYVEQFRAAIPHLAAPSQPRQMVADSEPAAQAVVYPADGTVSPFTVINLGFGQVQMGDCVHDRRLPALWFGKEGKGMGHEEVLNREAREGETIAVVTFANVEGLDVLLDVLHRIRRMSFPDAAGMASGIAGEAWSDRAANTATIVANSAVNDHGEVATRSRPAAGDQS